MQEVRYYDSSGDSDVDMQRRTPTLVGYVIIGLQRKDILLCLFACAVYISLSFCAAAVGRCSIRNSRSGSSAQSLCEIYNARR